jgi:hypothetical protein
MLPWAVTLASQPCNRSHARLSALFLPSAFFFPVYSFFLDFYPLSCLILAHSWHTSPRANHTQLFWNQGAAHSFKNNGGVGGLRCQFSSSFTSTIASQSFRSARKIPATHESQVRNRAPWPLSPIIATHPQNAPVTLFLATHPKLLDLKVLCLPHIRKNGGWGCVVLT